MPIPVNHVGGATDLAVNYRESDHPMPLLSRVEVTNEGFHRHHWSCKRAPHETSCQQLIQRSGGSAIALFDRCDGIDERTRSFPTEHVPGSGNGDQPSVGHAGG